MTADPDYSRPTPPGPAPQLPVSDPARPVLPRVAQVEHDLQMITVGCNATLAIQQQLLERVQALDDQFGRLLAAMESQLVEVQQTLASAVQAAQAIQANQVEVQQLADRLAVLEARMELVEDQRGT